MKLSIIAAISKDNAIGINNQLLCYLPKDLEFFKKTTLNNTIVMGRKTFDSIGKALPKRKNIIISRNSDLNIPNCTVVSNFKEAIAEANSEEIFIIGGASIYAESMSLVNKLYITKIHHSFVADTFFPAIDTNIWNEISREDHYKDKKHNYDFSFITYNKNK